MSSQFMLPGSVRAEPGRGGLPRLVVTRPAGSAEIYLQGAHVTAWTPAGGDPVLWMSQHSNFAPGAAIRGGVPVCFPWFGPDPAGVGPLHGFARTAPWTLDEVRQQDEDVVLVLSLGDADIPDDQARTWPDEFRARYTVAVGATLTLSLEVTNPGTSAITFQEAFHTYLAVGDVGAATIRGLEHASYSDRLAGGPLPADGEPLTIVGETDRLYVQPGTIRVADPVAGRTVSVAARNSASAVIWNPWQAKAAAMADFGNDEWTQMLCVETCNVSEAAVTLAPGQSHEMSVRLGVG